MPLKSSKPFGGFPWIQKEPSGSKRSRLVWALESAYRPPKSTTRAIAGTGRRTPEPTIILLPFSDQAGSRSFSAKHCDEIRGRVTFRITHDCHASAIGSYHVPLGNCVLSIVSALSMDLWAECQQQRLDRRLVKNCHQINSCECGDNLSALALGHYRPAFAFQCGYLFV